MSLTRIKTYSLTFTSDGVSTSLVFDAGVAPALEPNFAGNLPSAILSPTVTSTFTGPLSNVTAQLAGTKITVNFQTPPPQFDQNSNLVQYTLSFQLQYPA